MALANQIGLSNKYVSERHAIASQTKYTAGEAAKELKKLGVKATAKEVVESYKLINRHEPEWHHSGFYKNGGKSTMGRTFFFTLEQIEDLAENWGKVAERKAEIEAETKRKQETTIKGFYFSWSSDYGGNYGKKRNFKVLGLYEGSELSKPSNFTTLNDSQFEKAVTMKGKKYMGWDEPTISEFN